MSRPGHDLPEWLPFALVASAVVAIAAGVKAGWKTSAAQQPSQTPPVSQAGVLRDWYTGDYRI